MIVNCYIFLKNGRVRVIDIIGDFINGKDKYGNVN